MLDARRRRRWPWSREGGIEIERAPEGITLRAARPTTRASRRARRRPTRSSPRTTRRSGSTACSCTCRRASSSSSRSTSAIANTAEGGSLFWRLLVIAERGLALLADRGVRLAPRRSSRATRTRSSSSSSSRARSSSTSRSRTSRARPGTSPRTTRASGATPSSTGSPAASARRRARSGSRTTSPARARPRASPAPTSPTATQHLDYDTFQEHIAPEHDVGLRVQGRAARQGDGGLARDDPRRAGRAEDERLPGEPQPAALADGARGLDPGPRDPRERRALHPRRDASARSTASSSST